MEKSLPAPYRKSHIDIDEIYFWTATINKWQHLLKEDKFKDVIINSLTYLSEQTKIDVYAFIVMPNHIHLIWRVNELNGRESPQGSFLKFTAHTFKKMLQNEQAGMLSHYKVDAENKKYEFWRRDSLAIPLFTRKVAFQKLDYLHNNPLADHWNLVKTPEDYKYSSAKYYETNEKNFSFLKDLREVI